MASDSLAFDPSTAVPEGEFNPATAKPEEDYVRHQANQLLAQYDAGSGGDLSDEDHKRLVEAVYKGRPVSSTLKDVAAGIGDAIAPNAIPFSGTGNLLNKAWSGIKTAGAAGARALPMFLGSSETTPDVAGESVPDQKGSGQAATMAGAASAPLDVLNAGQNLATGAADLVDQGLPGSDERRLARIVRSGDLSHQINKSIGDIHDTAGVSQEDPLAQTTRFGAQFAIPVGVAGESAPLISKGADLLVDSRLGKAATGLATKAVTEPIQTTLPAIGTGVATTLATGNPIIGAAAAAGVPTSIKAAFKKIVDKIATDTTPKVTDEIPSLFEAIKQVAPGDTQAYTYIKNAVDKQIDDLKFTERTLREQNADDLRNVDKPQIPIQHLKGADKDVRKVMDDIEELQGRSKKLAYQSDVNKVLSYAGKLGLTTAGEVGVGGTTMAGISAAGAQPEQVEQASKEGFETGALLSASFAPKTAAGALKDLSMSRGRTALVARGAPLVDQDSIKDLPPESQVHVNMLAGAADALGKKVKVVAPDDPIFSQGAQKPEVVPVQEGQPAMPPTTGEAPNGRTVGDTLYLNRDALSSGVGAHEFTHATQEFFGQTLRESDPALMKKFEDEYAQRLGLTGDFEFSPQAERDAEVGRILLSKTPLESFYAGEKGPDVIKRIAKKVLSNFSTDKTVVDPTLQAPHNKADLEEMRGRMFKAGEEAAKPPQSPSSARPEVVPATTTPETQQNASGSATRTDTSTDSGAIRDAIQAAKVLGITDPEVKVQAAVQDLQSEGKEITPENLIARTSQRSVPKLEEATLPPKEEAKGPLAEAKIAPQEKLQVAVRLKNGEIVKGAAHGFVYDEINRRGLNLAGAEEGFVTPSGEFLYRDEAFNRFGESTAEDLKPRKESAPFGPEDQSLLDSLSEAKITPSEKLKPTGLDYDKIRTDAEAAKTEELSGTKRKTKQAEIERAGLEAMAKAHAQEVGPNSDLVTFRTNKFGKTSISGKRIDPNDPFHDYLLKQANLSSDDVQKLNDLEKNIGNTVSIDYLHAPEGAGEASGPTRKAEQAASTAPERVSGEGAQRRLSKSYVPTSITFNAPSKTFEVNGFSPDKFLNNADYLIPWAKNKGLQGYDSVNDPNLTKDFNDMVENHKNGYTMLGKPIEGTDVTKVKVNPDYEPHVLEKDKADLLNAMLGNEGAREGVRSASPEKLDKQALAEKNSPFWEASTGETNRVRSMLGDERKLLEPTSETLRPELIDRVRSEPIDDKATLRPSGFEGDRGKLMEKGTPRSDFAASGFMPSTDPDSIYDTAIKTPDGKIHTGRWAFKSNDGRALEDMWGEGHEKVVGSMHTEIVQELEGLYDDSDLDKSKWGYVTKIGQFLDKKEALAHARKINQLRESEYRALRGDDIGKKPEDIKTLDSMRFGDTRNFMPSTKPFYSQLQRTIEAQPDKANPDQLRAAILKGPGIKAAELKETKDQLGTSFEQWLKDNPRATKNDMLDFVRENRVQIKEVTKGGEPKINYDSPYAIPEVTKFGKEWHGEADDALWLTLNNDGDAYRALIKKFPELANDENWAEKVANDVFGTTENAVETKFQQYQLPGGKNYGETLATLPGTEEAKDLLRSSISDEAKKLAEEAGEKWDMLGPNGRQTYENLAERKMEKARDMASNTFRSSHWDEPNVVLHIRHALHDTADGGKSFVLEESQSDWGQALRRQDTHNAELIDRHFDDIMEQMKNDGVLKIVC